MRQAEVYVLRWRPKGDHHLVFEKCRQRWYRPVSADRARLVTEGPVDGRRHRQCTLEASASVHDGLGPDQVLHCVFGLHPRPTRLAPTGWPLGEARKRNEETG